MACRGGYFRKLTRAAVVIIVVSPVAAAVYLWFSSWGSGQGRESPDGRYIAHAYNLGTGTITGRRDWYTEVRVVETWSGREVWRVVGADGPDVPIYGGDGRFVFWSADSKLVTVTLGGGRDMTLPVP